MLENIKEGSVFQTAEGWYCLIENIPNGYVCRNIETEAREFISKDTPILFIGGFSDVEA